jgi:pimeloyl-ACP methyl ester carboxylesterase
MKTKLTSMKRAIPLFLLMILSGSAYCQQKPAYEFAQIGENRIAYSCKGQGEFTVVFISGMGLSAQQSFGNTYFPDQDTRRICLYDRAELGQSHLASEEPRTLAQIADELHELAGRDGWKNLILMPHSFGGFIARAYAGKYPDTVKGILFVDCVHEDWLPALKKRMSATDWPHMQFVIDWQLKHTHEDYFAGQEEARALPALGSLPITVISRGLPHTNIRVTGMSYEGVDIFNREHNRLQSRLLKLSKDSRHRIAKYSSHIVDETDPLLIIEEIEKLEKRIGATQKGSAEL